MTEILRGVPLPVILGLVAFLVLFVIPQLLGKTGRAVAARWFLGRPMIGRHYRTDATFRKRGTKLLHHAEVRAFWYRPVWQRIAMRQGWTLLAGVVVWAWFTHRTELLQVAAAVALCAAGFGAWWLYRRIVRWQVNRVYVQPLHVALSYALDLPSTTTAENYIQIPPSWKKNPDTPVKVLLPSRFDASADNQARIGGLLLQKLGRSSRDFTVDFSTVGQPFMVAKLDPKPPEFVGLTEEVVAKIDKLNPSEVLVGYDASDNFFVHNFQADSPHVGLCCESGAGKSAFLQYVAGCVCRQHPDNKVRAVDPKYASLPGLAGVPNVLIANDPIGAGVEEMWKMIEDVAVEVMRRGEALKNDPTLEFPMLLLIIDEVNIFASISATYWNRTLGEKGKPPVWEHILTILAAGRQFRVHAIIVGQDLRDSALGGIGLRTMLGLRAIGGQFDAQQWMRFIQTRPVERPSAVPGRWSYRIAGRGQTWIQNVYATPEEVNKLARRELPSDLPPEAEPDQAAPAPVTVTASAVRLGDVRTDQDGRTVTGEAVTSSVTAAEGLAEPVGDQEPAPVPPQLYTLAEAARQGIVPMTYTQLRQAKSRDGEAFPTGTKVGKREMWTADQLTGWVGDRLARALNPPEDEKGE